MIYHWQILFLRKFINHDAKETVITAHRCVVQDGSMEKEMIRCYLPCCALFRMKECCSFSWTKNSYAAFCCEMSAIVSGFSDYGGDDPASLL